MRVSIMQKLFGWSRTTYFSWKKENDEKNNRPIIDLIEKYFTDEDLEEFLETGEIQKLKSINHRLFVIKQKKINDELFDRIEKIEKRLQIERKI